MVSRNTVDAVRVNQQNDVAVESWRRRLATRGSDLLDQNLALAGRLVMGGLGDEA